MYYKFETSLIYLKYAIKNKHFTILVQKQTVELSITTRNNMLSLHTKLNLERQMN